MTKKKSAADVLLDAQVRFICEELHGARLQALVERQVDAALVDARKLVLQDVTSAERIKATALTYASDLEPSGDIPALVGDLVRTLYADPIHARTKLKDLVSERMFGQLLDKVLELKDTRERLVRAVVRNPLFTTLVSDLLYDGIRAYLADSAERSRIPGAGAAFKLGKAVMGKAASKVEDALEERLRASIARSVATVTQHSVEVFLQQADEELLGNAARDAWKELKPLTVASLKDDISALDFEELFVLLYEYWRELRKTPYYRGLIGAAIDQFFASWGSLSLAELLDHLGVDREVMVSEAMRHAPAVIAALEKKNLLAPLVRRQLEPFYRSEAFAEALSRI